jgi:hypothetical protein
VASGLVPANALPVARSGRGTVTPHYVSWLVHAETLLLRLEAGTEPRHNGLGSGLMKQGKRTEVRFQDVQMWL